MSGGVGASFGVHRASWVIVAGLLLTSTACAHGGAEDASEVPRDDRPVRLHVINRYALPVDIFAYGSGISYRMGTVYPGMTGDFVLRSAMIGGGPVEFVAQSADNAAAARSGQLLLGRGATVDFDIATRLSASTATVRP